MEATWQLSAVVDMVLAIAEEINSTAVQVSLAWLRYRAARTYTALIPILGPRNVTHLRDYLGHLTYASTTRTCRCLDDVSSVTLDSPHDSVATALANGLDGDRTLLDQYPVTVV